MHRLFFERRVAARARVDLPLATHDGGAWHACRAVDLSSTGMLVERARSQAGRPPSYTSAIELRLAGARPIRARARTVWSDARHVALELVLISDADRLTIAEHLDELARAGQRLH